MIAMTLGESPLVACCFALVAGFFLVDDVRLAFLGVFFVRVFLAAMMRLPSDPIYATPVSAARGPLR
jgi:hypothetical protein